MSAERELHAIYSRIPDLPDCDGSCATACRSVPAGPAEVQALQRAGKRLNGPMLGPAQLTSPIGVPCPVLTQDGACSAYEQRPVLCRLWGAAAEMHCPRGCEPAGGVLRSTTARRILRAAMAVPADPVGERVNEPDQTEA